MATGAETGGKHAAASSRQVPRLRDVQKALTRQRLVAASLESFHAKGYASTSIDDIVSGAGATRGTFYLHFASKAAVVHEVFDEAVALSDDVWESLPLAVEAGTVAALDAWSSKMLDYWEAHGVSVLIAQQAAAIEPSLWDALQTRQETGISGFMTGLGARTSLSKRELRLRGVACFAIISGLFEEWSSVKTSTSRPALKRVLLTGLVALLEPES